MQIILDKPRTLRCNYHSVAVFAKKVAPGVSIRDFLGTLQERLGDPQFDDLPAILWSCLQHEPDVPTYEQCEEFLVPYRWAEIYSACDAALKEYFGGAAEESPLAESTGVSAGTT